MARRTKEGGPAAGRSGARYAGTWPAGTTGAGVRPPDGSGEADAGAPGGAGAETDWAAGGCGGLSSGNPVATSTVPATKAQTRCLTAGNDWRDGVLVLRPVSIACASGSQRVGGECVGPASRIGFGAHGWDER
ncbi:hypothetical protein ACWCQM_33315 [Streptomyces sp. NPDC002125]